MVINILICGGQKLTDRRTNLIVENINTIELKQELIKYFRRENQKNFTLYQKGGRTDKVSHRVATPRSSKTTYKEFLVPASFASSNFEIPLSLFVFLPLVYRENIILFGYSLV